MPLLNLMSLLNSLKAYDSESWRLAKSYQAEVLHRQASTDLSQRTDVTNPMRQDFL